MTELSRVDCHFLANVCVQVLTNEMLALKYKSKACFYLSTVYSHCPNHELFTDLQINRSEYETQYTVYLKKKKKTV